MSKHEPAINILSSELEVMTEKIVYLQLCLVTNKDLRHLHNEGIRDHVRLRWQHTLSSLEERRKSIMTSIKKLEEDE